MVIHPAFSLSYKDLYEGLMTRVAEGYINCKEQGSLKLFNYSPQTTFEKKWDLFTKSARGLVLNTSLEKVECIGFPKFFNHGENPDDLRDLPFTITTKCDGSLGLCFFNREVGDWRFVTRGSFDSDQSREAQIIFDNYIEHLGQTCRPGNLDPNICYLFEIIFPANRIVLNYGQDRRLILLGAYNRETGEELNIWEDKFPFAVTDATCQDKVSPLYFPSTDHILEEMSKPYDNREGYIIRYEDGTRIKFKFDDYCRLHKIISRITPIGVYELILADQDKAALVEIPEEFRVDFEQIRDIILDQMTDIFDRAINFYNPNQFLSRKEYAILAKKTFGQSPEFGVAMSIYIGKTISEVRQQILKGLRPTRNILSGYTPTNSMNRFIAIEREE